MDADCAPPRRGPVGLEAAAEDAVLEERELGRVAGPAVRPDPLPEGACVRRSHVLKVHRFDAARTNAPAHVVVAQREAVREERDLLGVERRRFVSGDRKAELLDPFSPADPAAVERLVALQAEIHEAFKAVVRSRRGEALARAGTTEDVWATGGFRRGACRPHWPRRRRRRLTCHHAG